MTSADVTRELVDVSATGQGVWATCASVLKYRHLVRNLVRKDLSLKYRGSALGFFWSLVNPLSVVGVYTFAFRYVMGVRQEGFPFFVLIGITSWGFFASSTNMATGSVIEGGSLVRSVRFPLAVLPLATVLFNLAQYLLMLAVFAPLLFAAHRWPSATTLLAFPIVLVMQTAFTAGTALAVAAATTYFRDVRHFVELALMLLFWTTPVVYPLSQVGPELRAWIAWSPMTPFVVAYQALLFDGASPTGDVWARAALYATAALALGLVWFVSVERRLADHL